MMSNPCRFAQLLLAPLTTISTSATAQNIALLLKGFGAIMPGHTVTLAKDGFSALEGGFMTLPVRKSLQRLKKLQQPLQLLSPLHRMYPDGISVAQDITMVPAAQRTQQTQQLQRL